MAGRPSQDPLASWNARPRDGLRRLPLGHRVRARDCPCPTTRPTRPTAPAGPAGRIRGTPLPRTVAGAAGPRRGALLRGREGRNRAGRVRDDGVDLPRHPGARELHSRRGRAAGARLPPSLGAEPAGVPQLHRLQLGEPGQPAHDHLALHQRRRRRHARSGQRAGAAHHRAAVRKPQRWRRRVRPRRATLPRARRRRVRGGPVRQRAESCPPPREATADRRGLRNALRHSAIESVRLGGRARRSLRLRAAQSVAVQLRPRDRRALARRRGTKHLGGGRHHRLRRELRLEPPRRHALLPTGNVVLRGPVPGPGRGVLTRGGCVHHRRVRLSRRRSAAARGAVRLRGFRLRAHLGRAGGRAVHSGADRARSPQSSVSSYHRD